MRKEGLGLYALGSGTELVGSLGRDAWDGGSLVFGGGGGVGLFGPLKSPGREAIQPVWAGAYEDIGTVNGPAVELCGRA